MALCRVFQDLGAEIVGDWSTDGYTFDHSAAVVDNRFVGLVIDQRTQGMHTDARLSSWVDQVKPLLLERLVQVV
jgi:flavodoxin I